MKFAFYKGHRGKFTKANRAMTSLANVTVGSNAKLGFNNAVVYTDDGSVKVLMLGDRMLRTAVLYVGALRTVRGVGGPAETVTLASVHIDTDIVGYDDVDLSTGFRVLGERIVNEINRGTFDVNKLVYCRERSAPNVSSGLVNSESGEEFYVEA